MVSCSIRRPKVLPQSPMNIFEFHGTSKVNKQRGYQWQFENSFFASLRKFWCNAVTSLRQIISRPKPLTLSFQKIASCVSRDSRFLSAKITALFLFQRWKNTSLPGNFPKLGRFQTAMWGNEWKQKQGKQSETRKQSRQVCPWTRPESWNALVHSRRPLQQLKLLHTDNIRWVNTNRRSFFQPRCLVSKIGPNC